MDNLPDYGITPAKLEAFQARIDTFRQLHTAPRQRVHASTVATQALQNLFQRAQILIKEQIDRLMLQYQATHPDFYREHESARVVIRRGINPVNSGRSVVDPATAPNAEPTPLPKAA